MMIAAVGVDRSRFGERLQAALAGLQELHLLRDRQGEMVSWALRVDRQEPVTSIHSGPKGPKLKGTKEQRLDATLTVLKQQLSRLREQDVGLRTHLQQLDEQMSELKLDVNIPSTEQLESDSRPSSGFYELSDGSSYSLSNSCTSVYSECLSSSQTCLLLPHMSPTSSHIGLPSQVDECCRHSADESATRPTPLWATGLHLGSSRIHISTTGTKRVRPRPVSTGDLDKMMTRGLGYYKPADSRKPSKSTNWKITTVNPKFQSNLVSCSVTEMFRCPSPLHAVAFQSPVFSQGVDPGTLSLLEGQGPPVNRCNPFVPSVITQSYINKLILRNLSKLQSNTATEALQTHSDSCSKSTEVVTIFHEVSKKEASVVQPLPAQDRNVISLDSDQKRHSMTHFNQDQAVNADCKQSVGTPEVSYQCSCPVAMREYNSDEVTTSPLKKSNKSQGEYASIGKNNSENVCEDNPISRQKDRNCQRQISVMAHSFNTEESQGFEVYASPEFVNAKFFPAGFRRVKLRQEDQKAKGGKVRRKSNETPRLMRQQLGYSFGERIRETCGASKGEQRRSGKGKVTQKCYNSHTEERSQGSASDSSHSIPGVIYSYKTHPKTYANPAELKSSKSQRLQDLEYEQTVEPRERRQGAARCMSDVAMHQAACAEHQRSKNPHAQALGSMPMVQSVSAKSGQWIVPPRPFQSSTSSNLNAKYPPAPFHMSSHCPPRCESEYSAECGSLFHSTIAESSEGKMGDNTTNCFGDSESSQSFKSLSDVDSSLSLDEDGQVDSQEKERDLVWAEVALGPVDAGLFLQELPRPEPSACRIKASRALKKKIRQFQPTSLKVMTLV